MNVVHSVEAVDRTLTFNNQSQDSLDVIIPLIVDMVALETVEKLYLRMELVSPVSEDVELVEPTLAVVSIFDNGGSPVIPCPLFNIFIVCSTCVCWIQAVQRFSVGRCGVSICVPEQVH